jgi:hypothetical protein
MMDSRKPPQESLSNGMLVLGCFSSACQILTAEQIGWQLKLLPATIECLAGNLVMLRYLEIDSAGAYRLARPPQSFEMADER